METLEPVAMSQFGLWGSFRWRGSLEVMWKNIFRESYAASLLQNGSGKCINIEDGVDAKQGVFYEKKNDSVGYGEDYDWPIADPRMATERAGRYESGRWIEGLRGVRKEVGAGTGVLRMKEGHQRKFEGGGGMKEGL